MNQHVNTPGAVLWVLIALLTLLVLSMLYEFTRDYVRALRREKHNRRQERQYARAHFKVIEEMRSDFT